MQCTRYEFFAGSSLAANEHIHGSVRYTLYLVPQFTDNSTLSKDFYKAILGMEEMLLQLGLFPI
jgi:hypothetical protein